MVGLKLPGYNSLANIKNGFGFCLKKLISNIACGSGRLYFCRLWYRPVSGLRKSGIPAAEKYFIIITNMYK